MQYFLASHYIVGSGCLGRKPSMTRRAAAGIGGQPAVNVQTAPLICYTEKMVPAHRIWIVLVLLSGWLGLPLAAPADPPDGYYDPVDATLHAVIDDHQRFPYTSGNTDTWDILNLADEDPNNSGNILDVYKNASYPKISGGMRDYNREHTWPKSYGFPDNTPGPYTDCHHLFLCDPGYNTARSNHPYRTCSAACSEKTTLLNNGRGGGSTRIVRGDP